MQITPAREEYWKRNRERFEVLQRRVKTGRTRKVRRRASQALKKLLMRTP